MATGRDDGRAKTPTGRRRGVQVTRKQAAQYIQGGRIDLTPREMQVLELVAKGLTVAEVATQLGVRRETVRAHLSRVIAKVRAPKAGRYRSKIRGARRREQVYADVLKRSKKRKKGKPGGAEKKSDPKRTTSPGPSAKGTNEKWSERRSGDGSD